jgi:SET domain-containing protein
MNHSCEPNVQVSYMRGDHSGAVIALRDLAEGEELCINYTDTQQSEELRRQSLRHYGFQCECGKCVRERA